MAFPKNLKKTTPILQVTDNWRKLIADPNINAIVVGTWPHLHKTITVAALRAGKHILTEARMVMLQKPSLPCLLISSLQDPDLSC